ncbi:MAG TPA: hypothetical protein DCQ83_06095 [Fibrobacteres bacterium]|jgi:cell division septal protein FtsQ|nr:hypothetical protein [Fibrobacterota bacterium]
MSKLVRFGSRKTGRRGANKRQKLEMRRVQRRDMVRGLGRMGWKRLFTLLVVLAVIGAVSYGARMGLRAYQSGRILTINRLEVTGNHYWESSQLLERAGLEVGSKIPVTMRSAREVLRKLPGIQSVDIHASFDGNVRIEIHEESVLAMRRSGGEWKGLTPSGVWMALRETEEDLPVIDGDGGKDVPALAHFLAGARSDHPQLFSSFSQIAVRGSDEADVYWRDGRFMARIDYVNNPLNSLEFLQALTKAEQASWPSGSTVDLRVEGYAYVR